MLFKIIVITGTQFKKTLDDEDVSLPVADLKNWNELRKCLRDIILVTLRSLKNN